MIELLSFFVLGTLHICSHTFTHGRGTGLFSSAASPQTPHTEFVSTHCRKLAEAKLKVAEADREVVEADLEVLRATNAPRSQLADAER